MSLAEMFRRIGTPLVNERWSWGASTGSGLVVLRVWKDEMVSNGQGQTYVRLINRAAYRDAQDNLGYQERCEHVQMLADGADGYGVLCTAAEPKARSRKIVSFDARTLLKLGHLDARDGDEWARVVERTPFRALA